MTLALRLGQKGFEVSLIESGAELGGLASSSKIGPYTWDRFYHVILMSDLKLINLLEELKLSDQLKLGQTKTGFFTDGHLYSMSNSIEFLTFPPLGLVDKFRLGGTIFYASKISNWKKLEEISVVDWLRKLSGMRTFNKIWLPLLKSKLGENYKIANAAFIWSIIARMYAARRSGLKKEMFGYLDGGYEKILEYFKGYLNKIGVEIIRNTSVNKIVSNAGVELGTATGKSMRFDDIILTNPCSQIPDICPQLSPSEKKRFKDITYQGIICAALILKKPLAEYYITNITDERVPFTAVIEMTALVDKKYFDGNSLVYLPRYVAAKDPFWEKSDPEIEEGFYSALQSMYPSFERKDCLSFEISKAREVLPIPTLNYSAELIPPTRTSLKHVHIVNSAQIANGTMNVNEIIGLADAKAAEIRDFLS
jgi:protoporphyrinogen oxidase